MKPWQKRRHRFKEKKKRRKETAETRAKALETLPEESASAALIFSRNYKATRIDNRPLIKLMVRVSVRAAEVMCEVKHLPGSLCESERGELSDLRSAARSLPKVFAAARDVDEWLPLARLLDGTLAELDAQLAPDGKQT